MAIAEIRNTTEDKMKKSIESLKSALAKIRTGRASTGLLDHVRVEYYGQPVPVSQVANVTVIDNRTLGVSPWEKNMVSVVDKAIRESDLGLNPAVMGELIRVPMPPLSEERRRELSKVVRSEGEHAKVAVRNLRRDANDHLKRLLKDKDISEDDERRAQDDIQKLTDRHVAEIDRILDEKEKEIMTV
ncbi:MAG: ribosome recycling factor [Burkholderiaceae bacterium]